MEWWAFRWAAAGKRLLVCTIQVAIFSRTAEFTMRLIAKHRLHTNTLDPTTIPQHLRIKNPDFFFLQMLEIYFLHILKGTSGAKIFCSESVNRCPALAVMNQVREINCLVYKKKKKTARLRLQSTETVER
ncbi:hypothetical protein BZA77DRAFT_310906 [Pyronema omphalodes]|nr:hypothetical protein BZA77DRAFT_310906 [Pyronema omphalodes]